MRKKYNTPHRSRVVKTRLSEDEYADFTARLAPYGISQSEFLRQAIRRTTIRPVIHVSAVNDELLSAVGKLAAEYGRIGGNLNQIARYLNEYGVPYNTLSGEVRAAISDLAVLKYEVLKKVGDAVGNTQAYQKHINSGYAFAERQIAHNGKRGKGTRFPHGLKELSYMKRKGAGNKAHLQPVPHFLVHIGIGIARVVFQSAGTKFRYKDAP